MAGKPSCCVNTAQGGLLSLERKEATSKIQVFWSLVMLILLFTFVCANKDFFSLCVLLWDILAVSVSVKLYLPLQAWLNAHPETMAVSARLRKMSVH